jgi:hypothetical protein
LVSAALLGGTLAATSCGNGPSVVGTTRVDWRPVGCPQALDPPIYFAEADGDIFRMNPGDYAITRIGAASCPMAGRVGGIAINRRNELILPFANMNTAGKIRLLGPDSISACETVALRIPMPVSLYSGITMALRDEGDAAGDDVFLYAQDSMRTTSYLARSPGINEPGVVLGQLRFSDGTHSDGLCISGRSGAMDPPTCDAPRVPATLSAWTNAPGTDRTFIAVTLTSAGLVMMTIVERSQNITEVKPIQGVPLDLGVQGITATVWGDTVYLFLQRGEAPMVPPDGGRIQDAGPPTYTSVYRVSITTGIADASMHDIMALPVAATVPPCMRYAPM